MFPIAELFLFLFQTGTLSLNIPLEKRTVSFCIEISVCTTVLDVLGPHVSITKWEK